MTQKTKFKVRIDRETLTLNEPAITGAGLLALVGKTPQTHRLHQKLKGGQVVPVGPHDIVNLAEPGIERFMTLPLDQTEGDVNPRREVALPREDCEYLETLRLRWETVADCGKRWLLIHEWPTHSGYHQSHVTLALLLPGGYPDSALDMAYFYPSLARKDGRPIGRTNATVTIGGRVYQRWSRHRTPQNPWRPGVDCLASHVAIVRWWLEREFK